MRFSSRQEEAEPLDRAPANNPADQLDAAAAGAEELEPESLDEVELDFSDDDFSDDDFSDDDFSDDDFSDDEEPVDSEPAAEPLDELLAELLAASRLSVR